MPEVLPGAHLSALTSVMKIRKIACWLSFTTSPSVASVTCVCSGGVVCMYGVVTVLSSDTHILSHTSMHCECKCLFNDCCKLATVLAY